MSHPLEPVWLCASFLNSIPLPYPPNFIGPSKACACFWCCLDTRPTNHAMHVSSRQIANTYQTVITRNSFSFLVSLHVSCLFITSQINCQATPKEVAQQQPPPPQPQQQSGEGAAFNNMAPTAAAAPGYPYAMSQAAAAPGAQGMSFIVQVRRFKFVHSTWRIQIFGQMEMDTADDTFIFAPMVEERHIFQSAHSVSYYTPRKLTFTIHYPSLLSSFFPLL